MKPALFLVALLASASLLLADDGDAKRTRQHRTDKTAAATAAEPEPGAKIIHYGAKDVIRLNAKIRFTSTIILPANEQILDLACGDKEWWVVNASQNLAFIKPAKEESTSNLNLITSAGNIYSFVLVEVSGKPGVEPDLKIFVQPKEESMITASQHPRFVSSQEFDSCREQLRLQKEETQHTVDTELAKEIASLNFGYRFQPDKKPFYVQTIFHDRKFTYIVAKPDELPSLYEMHDGKPNRVNFLYKDGIYTADHVVNQGYLSIGKQVSFFFRKVE